MSDSVVMRPSVPVRVCKITDAECFRECCSGRCKLEKKLEEHGVDTTTSGAALLQAPVEVRMLTKDELHELAETVGLGSITVQRKFCQVNGLTVAASPPPQSAQLIEPKLAVWFGCMPESNGKANWTAILHRGDMAEGFTVARSEYHDRVRYDADKVRWLLGELEKEPFILDYDGDMLNPAGWQHPCGVIASSSDGSGLMEGKDAARYRWLRDKSEPNICAFYLSVGMGLHGVKFVPATVDEAIDAAMKAEQSGRTDTALSQGQQTEQGSRNG